MKHVTVSMDAPIDLRQVIFLHNNTIVPHMWINLIQPNIHSSMH